MFEGQNPWQDPLMTPGETIPDSTNAWLQCIFSRGGDGQGGKPIVEPPEFPETDDAALLGTPTKWDYVIAGGGAAMIIQGVSLIAMGTFLAGSAIAIAATGPAALVVSMAVIGSVAAMLGFAAALGGIAALIAGVDPDVLEFKERVLPQPKRKVALPSGTPAVFVELLDAASEMEQLSTGEIDLANRTRAAATAGDLASYEMHLHDLFTVQTRKQGVFRRMAKEMRNVNAELEHFSEHMGEFPAPKPLRDVVMPAMNMRRELADMGISPGEQNAALGFFTLPSLFLGSIEAAYNNLLTETKSWPALFNRIADSFDEVECVSWDAYGWKPQTL